MRRLLCTIMLIAAAGAVVPAAAGTAAAAIRPDSQRFGARLVDVPVSEAHNPRALRYIIDYLRPGEVIHRRILVVCDESRRARLTVYPDAATITKGYFIGDAGATRSELTTWITVRHPVLNLRPGGREMDMVTIRVPRIATRGEHYGVIWVQQEGHARTASGVRINEVTRVGIRIYLGIGKGGAPPTKFAITSITGATRGHRPLIVAHVRNTGGRAVDLAGTARLTRGPAGPRPGRSPSSRSPPWPPASPARWSSPPAASFPGAPGRPGSGWPAGSTGRPVRRASSSARARAGRRWRATCPRCSAALASF